jgi:hypothetical protein
VSLKLLWLSPCADLHRQRDCNCILLTWTDCVNKIVFCYTVALLVWLIGMIRFGKDMLFWYFLSVWHWFSYKILVCTHFTSWVGTKLMCGSVCHLFLMNILYPCVFLSWLSLIEGKLKEIILLFFPRVGMFCRYLSFTETCNVTCTVFMELCRCNISSTFVVLKFML